MPSAEVVKAVDFDGFLETIANGAVVFVCADGDVEDVAVYLEDRPTSGSARFAVLRIENLAGHVERYGDSKPVVIAASAAEERALIASTAAVLKGRVPVYGLIGDLFINASAGGEIYSHAESVGDAGVSDSQHAAFQHPDSEGIGQVDGFSYAVASLPRSGSTYLCQLLESSGLGSPREHLRGGFMRLVNASGFDAADLMSRVLFRSTPTLNDRGLRRRDDEHPLGSKGHAIFGTKLISHFVLSIEDVADRRCVVDSVDKLIVLDREDTLEQAISWAMAKTTGMWHLNSDEQSEHYHRELEDLIVDERLLDAVASDFNYLVDERQAWTELLAASKHEPLSLTYSELVAEPQLTIDKIARFLGTDLTSPRLPVNAKPMRSAAIVASVRHALDDRLSAPTA